MDEFNLPGPSSSLADEHSLLVERKFSGGLSAEEEERLSEVRRLLDEEEAPLQASLDRLEGIVERHEQTASGLKDFLVALPPKLSLSERQQKALRFLRRCEQLRSTATCSIVGAALTGRQSAYGHQTSAREGGRTLMALRRRNLVYDQPTEDSRHRLWYLTAHGRREAEKLDHNIESHG